MASRINKIDNFHSTRRGKLVFGFVELGLAFVLLMLATDSGELWQYGLAIVLLVGGLRNLKNVANNSNGRKK